MKKVVKGKKHFFSNIIWSIFQVLKFSKIYLAILGTRTIFDAVCPVLSLLLTQKLIDGFQLRLSIEKQISILIILLFIGLLSDIANNFFIKKEKEYELKFELYFQEKVFNKISKLSCKKIENSYVYDLISRTQYDANLSIQGNVKIIFSSISVFISTIGYLIIFINYNIMLTLIILFVPIFRFIFEKKFNVNEYKILRSNTENLRKGNYIAELIINSENFKELKLFSLFNLLIERYRKIMTLYNEKMIKLYNARFFVYSLITLMEVFIHSLILIDIIKNVIIGNILIGKFILYNSSMSSLNTNISSFFSQISILYKNIVMIEEIKKFFSLEEEDINDEGMNIDSIYSIRFDSVSYRYSENNEYVLKNISFRLEKDKIYLLIGENGSGKTTIIKILSGLYTDYEGDVYINEINLKEINLKKFRKQISLLFQDFIRYELTIKENILFGNLKFNNKQRCIEEYLECVGLGYLKKRMDIQLGYQFENGQQLSVGQWQRIALARSLLRDGSVYIFDEPNASIDVKSEKIVLESIFNKSSESIEIMVSHRFYRFVKKADEIIVLKDGEIAGKGGHDYLIKYNDIYKELYLLQKDYIE